LTINLIGKPRVRAVTHWKCIKEALVEKWGAHFEERREGRRRVTNPKRDFELREREQQQVGLARIPKQE